jgi:hypothetical protein
VKNNPQADRLLFLIHARFFSEKSHRSGQNPSWYRSIRRRFATVATQKQIKANKQNSSKSTGPVTETGKAASSRNALSHGLTAERHFLEGEDPAEFAQLRAALVSQMQPVMAIEIDLVDRIARHMWRLKRVPAFEVAVISALAEPQEIALAPGQGAQNKGTPKQAFSSRLTIAQALEVAFAKNFFDKITRYEAGLVNQLRKAVSDLYQLINMRREQTIAAAVAKNNQSPPVALNATEALNQIKWPEDR